MNTSVVVDTSVLIAALLWPAGPARELMRLCLRGVCEPLISNALFLEYEEVSSRSRILEQCALSPSELQELLNAFYSVCQWVPIYYLWRPNLPDEGDNFLIELAIAGNAYCVVTNNIKDIKGAELSFPDLHVLTPEQFLRG